MSLTKPVQIDKQLHKRLKEASGWHVESVKDITERALNVELLKMGEDKVRAALKAEEGGE